MSGRVCGCVLVRLHGYTRSVSNEDVMGRNGSRVQKANTGTVPDIEKEVFSVIVPVEGGRTKGLCG